MGKAEREITAFFGKMTASFTHEVKNILAIIQEAAGLAQDILDLSKGVDPGVKQKTENTLKTIQAQIRRGMELTTNFNRFAHTTDFETAHIDLCEFANHMCMLTQRFAHMKKIALKTQHSSGKAVVATDPVLLHMTTYHAISSFLENPTTLKGEIILEINAENHTKSLLIRFEKEKTSPCWSPEVSPPAIHIRIIQDYAPLMGAKVDIEQKGVITLAFPKGE